MSTSPTRLFAMSSRPYQSGSKIGTTMTVNGVNTTWMLQKNPAVGFTSRNFSSSTCVAEKCYGVARGKDIGLFFNAGGATASVNKFSHSLMRRFGSPTDAKAWLVDNHIHVDLPLSSSTGSSTYLRGIPIPKATAFPITCSSRLDCLRSHSRQMWRKCPCTTKFAAYEIAHVLGVKKAEDATGYQFNPGEEKEWKEVAGKAEGEYTAIEGAHGFRRIDEWVKKKVGGGEKGAKGN